MPRRNTDYVSFSLHKEIMDLKAQLSEKESELLRVESSVLPCSGPESTTSNSSASEAEEWQAKYERLVDAHKKLQRTNICLEEKLLKVVDKFESDKNHITRDLATQTQKVVEAKLTIQQLHKQNTQLKSDLNVALNILQMKPNSFISQRMESLPDDLQCRVRQYASEKHEDRRNFKNGGQKITIAVPNGAISANSDEAVSAAILAKVLEERENERKKEQKFCIDIGTQTHGWQFPDALELLKQARTRKLLAMRHDYSLLEELSYFSTEKEISNARKRLLLQKSILDETDYESDEDLLMKESEVHNTHVSNILLASLIHPPPSLSSSGHHMTKVDNRLSPPSPEKSLTNHHRISYSIPSLKKETTIDTLNNFSTTIVNNNNVEECHSENDSIKSFSNILQTPMCRTDTPEDTHRNALDSDPSYESLLFYTDVAKSNKPSPMNEPPIVSDPSSLSSLLSLTQKASTPKITSNAYFKRSISNTSYSMLQTDM